MNKEYIKNIPVSKLKPYERNPRKNKHAVEVLAKSIQRVGNNDPIEVNEDYVILCGHTRKQALEKLNIKTTDIVMIKGLTEEQQNEYRITNNKTGEIAEWDFEVLEEDFSVDHLSEFGFNKHDFSDSVPDIKKINTEGYNKIHILISFSPDYYVEISDILEKLKKNENVEYEQSAN